MAASLAHQRDVAGVQVAHGRHEGDPALALQRGAQGIYFGVDLHVLVQ